MDMNISGTGGQLEGEYSPKSLIAVNRNPTLTETLRAKKADLEGRLAEVTNALNALEANPAVESVLNLVARIR